jgi:hypothetical protein
VSTKSGVASIGYLGFGDAIQQSHYVQDRAAFHRFATRDREPIPAICEAGFSDGFSDV